MARVIIVGGGVIGLAAAKLLASNGIQTELYESKRHIGEGAAKASGIISISGLSRSGIEYQAAIVNKLYGAELYVRDQRLLVKSDKPQAYILDRAKLAEICEKEALRAGATIHKQSRLTKIQIQKMAQDTSNIIVGADGFVSTVASAFGFPAINKYILTYKAEYQNAHINDPHIVGLYFSKKLARGLFGWYAPYSSTQLEVGIGIGSRYKTNSKTAFSQFASSHYMQHMIKDAKLEGGNASVIPLAPRAVTVKRNVLLVGDAAGQVKATTGGGIVFGIACAKEAATAITNHIQKHTPLNAYQKMWRQKYGNELMLHRLIHSYYSTANEKSLAMFFRLSKLLGAERFLARYGDMDNPSLVLKRLFLRDAAG